MVWQILRADTSLFAQITTLDMAQDIRLSAVIQRLTCLFSET
jgi:hypothetical protein